MGDNGLKEKEYYKDKILKMIGEIEDDKILMKIYTVVKTHLKILREKEQEG